MKKIFVFLAALGCITALSACGSASSAKHTPPDGSLDKCTLRFSWWGGDDRHEATLAAIKLWEQKHPDITITPEYGGWDGWTEKVSSQISGGTAPDVMQINYDWLVSLSPDGSGFYDLGLLTDRLDLSAFDDEVLSFGRMNGKLNAVTVSVSGRGLFYNSDTFRKCGVSYPETWPELLALGEKMSEKGCCPLDLDIQSGGTAWYLAVVRVQQDTGRQFVTMDGELGFTEDDIRAALDFYKELEDSRVIRTVRERIDEDGNAALYQSPSFIDGRVGGVLEWGSSVGKYDMVLPEGTLQAGAFLRGDGGESGGWMIKPSVLYAIAKDTDYPDEAAAFMDFMLSDPECAAVLGTTRGIPASHRAEEALEAGGLLNGLARDSDELLSELDTVTISPYMELPRMKELCNTAIEKVSYGKADTAQAAKELYTSAEEYLRKVRK
ncbi:MAG: ABC transporter substrate-binding protein [Ruminococcus sp.]|nr:ABC transporter substrate-binding protein [Ruminococcus sp.]